MTLDLENKKVTKSTVTLITNFIHENKDVLSLELRSFYSDIRSMIEYQLRKKSNQRLSMPQILERVYNIESYIIEAGAISYEVEYVK